MSSSSCAGRTAGGATSGRGRGTAGSSTRRGSVCSSAVEKAEGGSIDEIYRVERTDGTILYIRDRGRLIRDSSGKPYRFAGIAEDVTDRIRAEEERAALLERETQARAAAEAALE